MADDVIILLSSDDELLTAPIVSVTAASRRAEKVPSHGATGTTDSREISGALVAVGAVGTPLTANATKTTERAGFYGFSSDDAASPFPTLPTQYQAQRIQTPVRSLAPGRGQVACGFLPSSSDAPMGTNKNHEADTPRDRAVLQTPDFLLAESVPRPRKRQRLSPISGMEVVDVVETNIEDAAARRSSPPASPQSLLPARRLLAEIASSNHPTADKPASLTDLVPVIELLSSSCSEADRTTSSKERHHTDDTNLDDTGTLFMSSSPSLKGREWARKEAQHGNEKGPAVEKELSTVVLLLSSSSPLRPGLTHVSHAKTSTETHIQEVASGVQSRRRPYKRSHSEGHGLVLTDKEDDETGRTPDLDAINSLLAKWREEKEVDKNTLAPPVNGSSAARRSVSDIARSTTTGGKTRRAAAKEGNKEEQRKVKEADQAQRQKDKEAEKKRKQQEREVERERKRIAAEVAKEKKAEERAAASAFNDANKSRTDKSVAALEMIVRLSPAVPQATREVLEPMLTEIKAEFETWTCPVDGAVVTWRRKVTSEYETNHGHWVPVPLRLQDEKHVLVVLRGEEFVKLMLAQDPEGGRRIDDLGGHVRMMRRHFPGHSVLYMIEGFTAWRAKNKSIRNRQFAAAVRGAAEGDAAPRAGRRRSNQAQHVDEELVEDALLALQVEHGVLVHESVQVLDTARWIRVFTEQIATSRYRRQKEQEYEASASFCMDAGQISTGDGGAETYALMLQQIARVTEPVAMGVTARYNSLSKLVQGLATEGPLALEACLKTRNRNGELSDQTIGPALSRRIYKVFMGEDEESTDI